MLKNIPLTSCSVHSAIFLKYIQLFFNIMHERVKGNPENMKIFKIIIWYLLDNYDILVNAMLESVVDSLTECFEDFFKVLRK